MRGHGFAAKIVQPIQLMLKKLKNIGKNALSFRSFMLDHNEFYLYLIRHGQSEFNTMPDRMGQFSDTPLTEKGQQQAWKLNERFKKERQKFDKVFSSDY